MGHDGGTGKIVKRGCAQRRADDAETRTRSTGIRILKSEPPSIDLPEDCTSNLVPIRLRVLGTSDREILCFAANWPTGFSDPHWFTGGNSDSVVVGLEKDVVAGVNRVGFSVLEIGICIDAKEVAGFDYIGIGPVDPCCPGINVTDGSAAGTGTGNGGTDLSDITDDIRWIGANTREIDNSDGRVSVEVFASD